MSEYVFLKVIQIVVQSVYAAV